MTALPLHQKRGRKIAMNADEVDVFLREQRTCRLGSVGTDGAPHVSPVWYVWDGAHVWITSLTGSQRWANLVRDPRVSVLVDAGEAYDELRGVEILGRATPVGQAPRLPDTVHASVAEPEGLFGRKYGDGSFRIDGRHGWLRVEADKIVSWDFRKIPAG